ncbi:hypothetical protein [Herbidospora sp. NBRC 101105]|uniref:hypothetical protein n=1 Tax=Herbidospora sp. NBRC 101105 TaxID=3032195 RepID=UPI0024A43AFC|nr:hypothetical protein [Herbidospora sp. NBRC 101105]GLX93792.1 hypothetical protein Hesp01_17420 [Herbidospora sp. NBRC 101105]
MRGRLPVALLLLLSAFLLGPAPATGAPGLPVAIPNVAPGGSAPLAQWGDPAPDADRDTAPPRLRPGWAVAAPLLLPAVLPSTGWPVPVLRAVAAVAASFSAVPRPAAGRAPARAPPSTTR